MSERLQAALREWFTGKGRRTSAHVLRRCPADGDDPRSSRVAAKLRSEVEAEFGHSLDRPGVETDLLRPMLAFAFDCVDWTQLAEFVIGCETSLLEAEERERVVRTGQLVNAVVREHATRLGAFTRNLDEKLLTELRRGILPDLDQRFKTGAPWQLEEAAAPNAIDVTPAPGSQYDLDTKRLGLR